MASFPHLPLAELREGVLGSGVEGPSPAPLGIGEHFKDQARLGVPWVRESVMGSGTESLSRRRNLVVGMVLPVTTFGNADSRPTSGQLSCAPSCSPLPVGSSKTP